MSTRRSFLTRLLAAAGWAIATAVAAGGSWAVAMYVARSAAGHSPLHHFSGGTPADRAVLLAGIGAGWGFVVGVASALVRRRTRWAGLAVRRGLGLALAGATAGALTLVLSLPVPGLPEVGSAFAWVVVGLYVGVVGYLSRRRLTGDRAPLRPPPGAWRAAARWGLAGALTAGGTWAFWLVVLRNTPAGAVVGEVAATVRLAAGLGAVLGFLVGLPAGARTGTPLVGCFCGAFFGLAAGVVVPLAAVAFRGILPVWLSSTLGWAVVGFVAGVIGYFCTRPRPQTDHDLADSEADTQPRECGPRMVVAWGGRGFGPVSRLLPILAVSAGCLVAVVVGTPSPAGWAMLAVGLLGLAVAWALGRQEKRIRELERRIQSGNE